MKILLKSDEKSKISREAKVYLLNNRNRKLVNETFNELYQLGRIS